MVEQERLSAALARIAQTLITEYGIADVLHDLCDEIAGVLGVDATSILLADERHDAIAVAAASDERSLVLARAELDEGQGPALQVFRDGQWLVVDDLGSASDFPAYAALALETGIRSVAAFPMAVHGRHIGSLVVVHDEPTTFGTPEVDAARTLAASATAYVLNARALDEHVSLSQQLQRALDSRIVIEQAKGKLSAQLGMDVGAAFDLLRGHARRTGTKLRDVAADVVDDRLGLRLAPTPDDLDVAREGRVPS